MVVSDKSDGEVAAGGGTDGADDGPGVVAALLAAGELEAGNEVEVRTGRRGAREGRELAAAMTEGFRTEVPRRAAIVEESFMMRCDDCQDGIGSAMVAE